MTPAHVIAPAARSAAARVTGEFNDATGTLRYAVRDTELPPAYAACWREHLLSRPLFADHAELHGAAADVLAFFDLLTAVPGRLFDGDLGRYCAALGIDGPRGAVLRRFAHGGATRYGRADLYHDGDGYRLLEFNVASDLGGADRAELQRALLRHPEFGAFAAKHDLAFVDTGARLAAALRAAAGAGPDEPVACALVCADGGLAKYRRLVEAVREAMPRHGLDLRLAELSDIADRDGHVTVAGRPVRVVLRFFTVDDLLDDPAAAYRAELLFRAHEDGRVALFTPMDSSLYSNKGALALLSAMPPGLLGPDEQALVDRLLPWSRLIAGGANVGTATAGLVESCRAQRAELILKPLRECGGTGIVVGWESTDQEWALALRAASVDQDGHIVQRRVRPRTEPVVDPETGAVGRWVAGWGIFVTPDGYAGTDVRALPADAGAILNYGINRRTRVTGAFTVPATADQA
ncbi:hypothetical protein F8271_21930 [Micromonospora sp. ALFpr18c]|uniref:glutathionylspermidine synthase family protein n=1 Tax=Micromonospora sp. ALFpr18c TaxID=1458665 RepID=UPI00124BA1E0|nr:glutathionylspermidine synthase family protein [Micromonospora sp. ALFpr18c]KAB1935294.1 hypothetical protein F8271_21930 [Micromonospora sp. ALFpr18c]